MTSFPAYIVGTRAKTKSRTHSNGFIPPTEFFTWPPCQRKCPTLLICMRQSSSLEWCLQEVCHFCKLFSFWRYVARAVRDQAISTTPTTKVLSANQKQKTVLCL